MTPYWLAYILVALAVINTVSRPKEQSQIAVYLIAAAFILMIGFRYEVGGDWGNYKQHLALMRGMGLAESLARGDPGYYFLNWVASVLNLNIAFVNFVCAIIVVWGLTKFTRNQPYPWLAYLVAIPYLIVVVSMGYTRQATALGFVMAALVELSQDRRRSFVFFVCMGVLFHKSAVLLLPIAALSATTNRIWTGMWVGAIALMAANLFLLDSADDLWQNYVEADYQSQGGLIRVVMNAVPSLLFLLYRDNLVTNQTEKRLWTWIAFFSLVTVPLVFISSTAVDRVALYFIPIQLFVFSRLPYLSSDTAGFRVICSGVVGYYALVLFVWLVFASNAYAWLPYDNYLFHGFSPPDEL